MRKKYEFQDYKSGQKAKINDPITNLAEGF